jgi:hypothetical protein
MDHIGTCNPPSQVFLGGEAVSGKDGGVRVGASPTIPVKTEWTKESFAVALVETEEPLSGPGSGRESLLSSTGLLSRSNFSKRRREPKMD